MAAGDFRGFRAGSTPQRLADEFNQVLEDARADDWDDQRNCYENPDDYVMFDRAPTKERAAWLCEGCPIRTLCRDYARATKPGWGVWGGEVWKNGSRNPDTPDEN